MDKYDKQKIVSIDKVDSSCVILRKLNRVCRIRGLRFILRRRARLRKASHHQHRIANLEADLVTLFDRTSRQTLTPQGEQV
jgi:hypothetical protein